jgi:diguanylate cyclase (GGDEF)-like protein
MPDNATTAFSLIGMNLDVDTLFMVTMHVEIILGLLLFFAWAQNFSKRALAWWGSAHLIRAVSIMLLGLYGRVPDSLSIDFANAVLFGSFALIWCGARVFDRRDPEVAFALVGVAVWLLACRLQVFAESINLRILFGSGIVTAYIWLAAFELWRGRDEALVSRWPAIFMLFAHGALFLLRTPLGAVTHLTPGNSLALSGWLELLSLEALLFTISIAFILLAMAKERTEYRHRAAARTDPLTGIANRRGFMEQIALSRRTAAGTQPTALLLFDLDHFKTINDRYGHAVGDRTLQIFADIARAHIGVAGTVGRWGGDEFVAVLHNTNREIAATVGERIQVALERAAADIDQPWLVRAAGYAAEGRPGSVSRQGGRPQPAGHRHAGGCCNSRRRRVAAGQQSRADQAAQRRRLSAVHVAGFVRDLLSQAPFR